jgi:gamma-glutamyl-gamma-aminobutyrate hydrolase PuuD
VKRLVGVSLRVVEAPGYSETRDAISHDWVRFLSLKGITLLLIPNVLSDPVDYVKQMKVSALILSSGNNVGPLDSTEKRYEGDDVSLERDTTENELIDFAIESKMPLLGVCRGMHMLNVHFGGGVVRDLTDVCGVGNHHAGSTHNIRITDERWRDRLGTSYAATNSFHRQAITRSTLSSQLSSFALADNDVVEGVYHPDLPIIGIQWHPERKSPSNDIDHIIIESWIQKAT